MSCPLCWHSTEAELSAMLKFQLCNMHDAEDDLPLSAVATVQVCPNCGFTFFIMPNEAMGYLSVSSLRLERKDAN